MQVVHLGCTGDAGLRFSLMLVGKTAVEEETHWAAWLYHWHNQNVRVTDCVTLMSLYASLLRKIIVAADCLCQVALNQKLLCKFQNWCKFSSLLKAKLCKMTCLCIQWLMRFSWHNVQKQWIAVNEKNRAWLSWEWSVKEQDNGWCCATCHEV